MKLNASKTNYIILKKKYKTAFNQHEKLNIKIENKEIEKAKNPALLGITLDENLSFQEHFSKITASLNSKINLLRKLSSRQYQIDPKHLITIYRAFSLSKIQYSMLPYTITTDKIRQSLKTTQNKALKTIYRLPKTSSNSICHTLANIATVETTIKRQVIKYISNARINNITDTMLYVKNFKPPQENSKPRTILQYLYPKTDQHNRNITKPP